MTKNHTVCIVGGGASGVFAALQCRHRAPNARILIIERSSSLLTKVALSGGGRCNLTNADSSIHNLASHYPRGNREIKSILSRFSPIDTMTWFESQGIPLKVESNGRVFPVSNNSATITEFLAQSLHNHDIEILMSHNIAQVEKSGEGFSLSFEGETPSLYCDTLLYATGSSPHGYDISRHYGHTVHAPIPALFPCDIASWPFKRHAGATAADIALTLAGTKYTSRGSVVITHTGLSGPAMLRLSSWAARYYADNKYTVPLTIRWLPDLSHQDIYEKLLTLKSRDGNKKFSTTPPTSLPSSLWQQLARNAGIDTTARCSTLTKKSLAAFADLLIHDTYTIRGRSSHKGEFVTCGGIALKEISLSTMESKICPNLYFAGEILDIDGETGGYNLQNAWSTGWIAGNAIGEKIS
jgi:predicted Rossmann fold flavoprotein